MINKVVNAQKEGVDFCFNLIGKSFFKKGAGDLDYLHLVRQPQYLQLPSCEVKSLEESYNKYEKHIYAISQELLDFFLIEKSESFVPQAILKPPTSRPQLQEPLFQIFRKQFSSIDDLSHCFLKNPSGEGIEKFSFSKNIKVDLTKIERILIIDDVYAEGNTTTSIMSVIGRSKIFVTICPLIVELGENLLFADLRLATEELFKKRKL